MKRIDRIVRSIDFGLLIIMAIAITGCSGHKVSIKDYPREKTIPMAHLKSSDATQCLNDCVFFVDAGETIPLTLSMESDFMTFKQGQIDIVAKQRLYFRVLVPENLSEGELDKLKKIDAQTVSGWSDEKRRAFLKKYMLYISKDAVHWAPISNIRALREVLGYKMGTVSFTMAAGTENGLGASLVIRTVK